MAKNKYGGINDMETGWTKNLENRKVYTLWFDMLRRCYDDEQLSRSKGKSYKNCKVCDQWFYLSNFYADIQRLPGYAQWKENGKMSIDKDLFSKGAKEYRPENCCFIPVSVNVSEMNRRVPDIMHNAREASKTKYVLTKEGAQIKFDSEKEACTYLGVSQCSVASCYRRGRRCKGFTIARMDAEEETE